MTREYTARETRWVTEYVGLTYPSEMRRGRVVYQMPVGPLAYGVTTRAAPRADAVIFRDSEVVVLEAETENITSAIGQLMFYISVLKLTPSYPMNAPPSVRGELLLESPSDAYEAFARSRGIDVVVWAPDWLLQYLQAKRGRYHPQGAGP